MGWSQTKRRAAMSGAVALAACSAAPSDDASFAEEMMLSSIQGQCLAAVRGHWPSLPEDQRPYFTERQDNAFQGDMVGVRFRMEFPATSGLFYLGQYTVDCMAEDTGDTYVLTEVLADGESIWDRSAARVIE